MVYKLTSPQSDETKVFKVITPSNKSIERLKREILAVKLIEHINIPQILATNVETITSPTETVWIVEEFVNGQPLREVIENGKVFSIEEVVTFFDTMLSILEKSESLKIIHRDIKPDNIIYDIHDKFWLIDFGISRHLTLESITETDSPFGPCTFGYSAAEQFRNRKKDIDIRADLFSLGVVAAEMVSGKNPYLQNTENILELIKKIENQPLPMLRIKGDKQYLLAKFIKNLGDNRQVRRPGTIADTKQIFELVKQSL